MKNNILILALLTLTFSLFQKNISQSSNCVSDCINTSQIVNFDKPSSHYFGYGIFDDNQQVCTRYSPECAGKIIW